MRGEGWVRVSGNFRGRRKTFFCDSYVVSDLLFDGKLPRHTEETPFDLERALKQKEVVPQDAYFFGYHYDIERDGIVMTFGHLDFPEIPMGERPDEERVPRFEK